MSTVTVYATVANQLRGSLENLKVVAASNVFGRTRWPHNLEFYRPRPTCRRTTARSTTASSSSWRRLKSVDISNLDSLFLLLYVLMSSTRSEIASCTSSIKARCTFVVVSPPCGRTVYARVNMEDPKLKPTVRTPAWYFYKNGFMRAVMWNMRIGTTPE